MTAQCAQHEPRWTLREAEAALTAFQTFDAPNPYQYHQLAEREIRLLKITLPAMNDWHYPMPRLEIVHTVLDSAPPFEALSYCWGNSLQPYKAPITIRANQDDDQVPDSQIEASFVPLTASLAKMLAYLPRHCIPPNHISSYVWIDQICINQSKEGEGEREKTHQISFMRDIYSKATRVLIWLGPGPDPATAETIGDIFDERKSFSDMMTRVENKPLPPRDVKAILYIWENAWFFRGWVVQESALARNRQPLVGLHPVKWKAIGWFGALFQILKDMDLGAERRLSSVGLHHGAADMWNEIPRASGDCDISRGLLLCSFLVRFGQHLQIGYPKDKVLAFMGLWHPKSFDIASTAEENHQQVYTRLAVSLVKDTRRLDILAAITTGPTPIGGSTAARTSLPSWVPRWDASVRGENEVGCSPLLEASYLEPPSDSIHWNASSPHVEHLYVSDNATLKTRGKIICNVDQVSLPVLDSIEIALENPIFCGEFHVTLRNALRVLIECTQLGRQETPFGSLYLSKVENLFEKAQLSIEDTVRIVDAFSPGNLVPRELYDAYARSFFTVAWPGGTGIRTGLGPGYTKEGDEIAILHGARFPVILRPVTGELQTYQVVGDCYIEGMMKGEAVDWKEKDANDIMLI